MLIRRAILNDLVGVERVDKGSFGIEAYPHLVLRQFMDLAEELFLVCEADGELVGYALGAVTPAGVGWIVAMAVDPKHRRRGIAFRLACAILGSLRRIGIRTVKLTVRPSNLAARVLYERLEFSEELMDENYFGPGEPRLLMTTDLTSHGQIDGPPS